MIRDERGTRIPQRASLFVRNHPEAILFFIGLMVFIGGLWTVLGGFFEAKPPGSPSEPDVRSSPPPEAFIGPEPGTGVASYVDARRRLLSDRAAKKPKTSSFAVVSFGSYMTPEQVEAFLKTNRLEPYEIHLRIPLPGFETESVEVDGKPLGDLTKTRVGTARIEKLEDELKELERIIPTVTDSDFRATYEEDAESRRKAIALLRADAGTIYAAVVKGSYANLAKAQAQTGVRLVDVSDEESADPATHSFSGLLPEETETVGLRRP